MGDIDTLVFDNLPVGTYQYILYDMMPDNTFGQYMPCPETMSFQLTQPLELITTASLIDHIDCWGDSTDKHLYLLLVEPHLIHIIGLVLEIQLQFQIIYMLIHLFHFQVQHGIML